MTIQYSSKVEQAHHIEAMQVIAEEIGMTFEVVRETYEHELERLQSGARLREYLPLLAARRARESLRAVSGAIGRASAPQPSSLR